MGDMRRMEDVPHLRILLRAANREPGRSLLCALYVWPISPMRALCVAILEANFIPARVSIIRELQVSRPGGPELKMHSRRRLRFGPPLLQQIEHLRLLVHALKRSRLLPVHMDSQRLRARHPLPSSLPCSSQQLPPSGPPNTNVYHFCHALFLFPGPTSHSSLKWRRLCPIPLSALFYGDPTVQNSPTYKANKQRWLPGANAAETRATRSPLAWRSVSRSASSLSFPSSLQSPCTLLPSRNSSDHIETEARTQRYEHCALQQRHKTTYAA